MISALLIVGWILVIAALGAGLIYVGVQVDRVRDRTKDNASAQKAALLDLEHRKAAVLAHMDEEYKTRHELIESRLSAHEQEARTHRAEKALADAQELSTQKLKLGKTAVAVSTDPDGRLEARKADGGYASLAAHDLTLRDRIKLGVDASGRLDAKNADGSYASMAARDLALAKGLRLGDDECVGATGSRMCFGPAGTASIKGRNARLSVPGAPSAHNPAGLDTEFGGAAGNQVRGDTRFDGNMRTVGDLTVGGETAMKGAASASNPGGMPTKFADGATSLNLIRGDTHLQGDLTVRDQNEDGPTASVRPTELKFKDSEGGKWTVNVARDANGGSEGRMHIEYTPLGGDTWLPVRVQQDGSIRLSGAVSVCDKKGDNCKQVQTMP